MRQLYLDTANVSAIEKHLKSKAIRGVTTNPSLMAKEPKTLKVDLSTGFKTYVKQLKVIRDTMIAADKSKVHLSVEVITLDPLTMEFQANELRKELSDLTDLHIKVPVLPETLHVISQLHDCGAKVNATGCMTALQAMVATAAGADIVSFFYNRMLDGGINAVAEITEFCQLRWSSLSDNSPLIICGSIRKPEDVLNCWKAGADIVTVSPKILDEMVVHPKTTEAVCQFQKDIEAWLS